MTESEVRYWHRKTLADLDSVRAERDYWKERAETAENGQQAWEENHQILTEHFHRMVRRAERAEDECADLKTYADSCDQALGQANCRGCHEVELDRAHAEQRAAAWWEVAKTLCRQRRLRSAAHTSDVDTMRRRAEDAETSARERDRDARHLKAELAALNAAYDQLRQERNESRTLANVMIAERDHHKAQSRKWCTKAEQLQQQRDARQQDADAFCALAQEYYDRLTGEHGNTEHTSEP